MRMTFLPIPLRDLAMMQDAIACHHGDCESVGHEMSKAVKSNQSVATIFDAWGDNPSGAIAGELAKINGAERKFRQSNDEENATALLDSIENLRRFVLVRRTLAQVLSRPSRRGGEPIGRQICEALHEMIGDVPKLVEQSTAQGNYRMERDTRRAIACLIFLGSLDPQFI
jgi:hypothetical protein